MKKLHTYMNNLIHTYILLYVHICMLHTIICMHSIFVTNQVFILGLRWLKEYCFYDCNNRINKIIRAQYVVFGIHMYCILCTCAMTVKACYTCVSHSHTLVHTRSYACMVFCLLCACVMLKGCLLHTCVMHGPLKL